MALSTEKTATARSSSEHGRGEKFQCQLCPKQLGSKYGFRKHLHLHSMVGKAFRCNQCSSAYRDKPALTRHLKYIHDPKFRTKFECPFCEMPFPRQSQLEIHLSKHTKEKPHFCKICPQEFSTSISLRNHQNTHKSDRQRIFPCDICPKKFFTWNTLHGHRFLHTGKKPFQCQTCKNCFVKKTELESHSLVHQSDREYFPCHICSKILATKGSLRCHLQTHNPERIRKRQEFDCNLCAKKLSSYSSLVHHIQRHLSERKFAWKCEICGKAFTTLFELKMHKSRVHSDARPFRCDECNKQFKTMADLKMHKRNHPVERLHECQDCKKSFKRKDYLQAHVLLHGRESFPCKICGREFGKKDNLKRHAQIHSSSFALESYKCRFCMKPFITPYHLRAHERDRCPAKKNQSQNANDLDGN